MRLLLASLGLLLFASCMPGYGYSPRQHLATATANYTRCGHVVVDCVDEECSNVRGGPWTATACGTRYRCTNTAGEVVCAPLPQ